MLLHNLKLQQYSYRAKLKTSLIKHMKTFSCNFISNPAKTAELDTYEHLNATLFTLVVYF